MEKISLLTYAGTKEQYLLIDQLARYFISTFNIDPRDCLIQVLLIMHKNLGNKNISLIDIEALPEKERRKIFRDAIYDLIDHYKLEADKLKIYSECLKLFDEWSEDFAE